MKYLLIFLLFCSCSAKKTTLKRELDSVINLNSRTDFLQLKNTFSSDSMIISFRQIYYDTIGRIEKETTGNVTKIKTEYIRDTIIQRDTVIVTKNIEVREDIKEEKKHQFNYNLLMLIVLLILIGIIYIKLKKMNV